MVLNSSEQLKLIADEHIFSRTIDQHMIGKAKLNICSLRWTSWAVSLEHDRTQVNLSHYAMIVSLYSSTKLRFIQLMELSRLVCERYILISHPLEASYAHESTVNLRSKSVRYRFSLH